METITMLASALFLLLLLSDAKVKSNVMFEEVTFILLFNITKKTLLTAVTC